MTDQRSPTDQLSDTERAAALTAALTGRYVVERELGRGGMATVYLAHDVRHLAEKDRALVRAFADRDSALVMSRNWDGLAAEYAVDAVRMPPNAPAILGRAAIRQAFEQVPPIPQFAFHLVHLDGDGTTAYLRGTYTITVAPPGLPKPIVDAGKVLAVFRKQPNGTWLCVAEAWNSDLPPSQ